MNEIYLISRQMNLSGIMKYIYFNSIDSCLKYIKQWAVKDCLSEPIETFNINKSGDTIIVKFQLKSEGEVYDKVLYLIPIEAYE